MSWNTSLTVVKNCTLDDLGDVLTYGEPTSCEDGSDLAVAVQVSGDVVVAGDPGYTDPVRAAVAATGRRTTSLLVGTTSDVYELVVRDGERTVRHLLEEAGETTIDQGTPLDRESLADGEEFAQDRFFALFQIAGGLMMGDWYFDPDGRVVAPRGAQPTAPDADRTRRGLRRWFGRA